MILSTLAVLTLAAAPADTTVLVTAKSFLWMSRPLVQLVRQGERTELLVTTRDPEFFTRPIATLYAGADTAGKAVAVIPSDTSIVDARYSTNRHTLRFTPTAAQLKSWAGGSTPALEVGGMLVKLGTGARERLKAVAGRAP